MVVGMFDISKADQYFRRLKYEIQMWIGCYPSLFRLLVRMKSKRKHLIVKKDTDLVVEGFPRSGNTFAVAAFMLSQPHPLRMAHHLHVPAQIIYAIRHNIPTLVLVRRPDDAVLSLVLRESFISLRQGLRAYIRFYRRVTPYLSKCVVASFDDVTTDFGQVIHRLKEKYGTNFVPFEHSEDNVNRCFALVEKMDRQDRKRPVVTETTVARPSKVREGMKKRLVEELGKESVLLEQAFAVYKETLAFIESER